MARILHFLAALVLLAGGNLRAVDVFVNNTAGDDGFDGSRPENAGDRVGPVRTIRRALRLARAGDQIVLAKTDQPYRENIALAGGRHSGSLLTPFILEGNGATLDGSTPIPADAWEHVQGEYFRFQPKSLGPHQMLFLQNGLPMPHGDGRHGEGRHGEKAANRLPSLEPMQWAVRDGWIYVRTEPGQLPDQYKLSYSAHDVGITLYGVRDVVVHDLVVQGFRIDGVQASDNVVGGILSGLTLRGNGRSGAAVQGSSQVELAGCLIGNNGEAQVIAADYSRTSLINCDLVKTPGEDFPALRQGKHARVEQ